MRTTTMQDIAEQAGVSAKTVSRVINGEGAVREDTRKRVLEVAQQLNYRPYLLARGLASGRSYTIGLVYDNPNAYYVTSALQGALKACDELGFGLQIHPYDSTTPDLLGSLRDFVHQSRLAGLVLAQPISERPTLLHELRAEGIPFVPIITSAKEPASTLSYIHVDDNHAAYAVTAHLIQLGHMHIGFLRGNPHHQATTERFAGYKAALKDYDIPFRKELVIDGDYLFEDGFRGARQLLQLPEPPTAIFGCNDEIAEGAFVAVRSVRLHVPSDISVAGFGDSAFSRHSWPPLTTTRQRAGLIVEHAARMLIARINGEPSTSEIFRPELLVRGSTAPPPLTKP